MEGRRSKAWVAISSLVLLVLLSAFLLSPASTKSSLPYSAGSKQAYHAPKNNVWSELTEQEASDVTNFINETLPELNLTKRPESSRDNFVFIVETLRPNKTDAAPYLFGDGGKPQRWAKAAVAQNLEDGPYMVYYMVGPLPLGPGSQVLPLLYIFNSGRNTVKNPIQDFVAVQDFGLAIAANISDVTELLLGASANVEDPSDPHGLLAFPRGSRVEAGGFTMWMQMYRPGMGSGARTLLPQGIYAKVDATSPNPDDWTVGQYYYNGIIYESAEIFRAAVAEPDFVRTPPNLDGPWTETEDYTSAPAGRELPPPVAIQPYGPRYKFDKEENFVSWFGFEFYFTTAISTGVSIFDVRFKGDRIVYELGLQEAMAHYAGDDPMQGGLEFLDTFFGMGKNAFELVPGYDCPAYADYVDVQFHQGGQTHTVPNSLCLFEFTADHLLSRHTAQYSVTASRNTFLTLRSVSTVGN